MSDLMVEPQVVSKPEPFKTNTELVKRAKISREKVRKCSYIKDKIDRDRQKVRVR
jgi:hypothetical protein